MTNKPKKINIENKLRTLYNLQLIDSRIDEIDLIINNLPLEIQQLDNELKSSQNQNKKIEDDIYILQKKIKEKKDIIENSKILIKKYQDQQYKIRNNREFESLDKEIKYQELEIELANKRIKEFKLLINQNNNSFNELQKKYNEKKQYFNQKQKEFNQTLKEYQENRKNLLEKSICISKKIEDRLLKLYKRIRSKVKNGLAIVPVERGASGGSFFTIPPQKCIDIAQRKKIVIDEHSGLILIDKNLAEEERKKVISNII